MRLAVITLLTILGLATAVNAADEYRDVAAADAGVKAGNPCSFSCTMSWGGTLLPDLTQGTVVVTKPDLTTFTPSFTTTYDNTGKTLTFDGSFTGGVAGTYKITFKGKDSSGITQHTKDLNVTILPRQ